MLKEKLMDVFKKRYYRFRNNVKPYLEDFKVIKKGEPSLEEKIKKAHEEWVQAQEYFNSVTDPMLIDHAIYKIHAAREKYNFLLSRAKKYRR
ncbi:DUF2508 family protein [Halothermothrix orenii]|uniref:DUF2508 domain-containing protein n=1 Tax=Halothermothrix orenii (strain H 168 / OCM 544 / DSM 9562) TaxID=373903 RepID=B8CZW8_HALOH|nr:DUF2508 family protein [Halothermothrix orenii]ACL70820.1 hypothetical protein Hore_20750 [Halothermothrix orenii H 168]